MGEEYGETAPFLYFIEHGEPVLVDAVRKGRQAEFASFASEGEESDPQDPATFERSRVHPGPQTQGECVQLLCWYRRLIGIRTSIPALGAAQRDQHEHDLWVEEGEQILVLPRRALHSQAALVILSFNRQQISVTLRKPLGTWELIVASWDLEFGGSGRNHFPATVVIGEKEQTISMPAYGVAVYLECLPSI